MVKFAVFLNDYISDLKIDSLETLKYDESKDTFDVVSKVIINPELKPFETYSFSISSYYLDVGINTDMGNFFPVDGSDYNSSCNHYYNSGDWSEYNDISPYLTFSSTVLAKDN